MDDQSYLVTLLALSADVVKSAGINLLGLKGDGLAAILLVLIPIIYLLRNKVPAKNLAEILRALAEILKATWPNLNTQREAQCLPNEVNQTASHTPQGLQRLAISDSQPPQDNEEPP